MELGQVVKDFLPPPDQLVPKGKTKTIQVTLEGSTEPVMQNYQQLMLVKLVQ
jgi:hypothetical protein